MATESLQKFAYELKSLRENKGISLVQISNRTKIDIKFLQAIEESRFDVLPEIYIRAFIKEYAQAIEQNAQDVLTKFDFAKSGKEEVIIKEQIPKEESKPEPVVEQAQPKIVTDVQTEPTVESALKPKANLKLNYILGGIVLLVALGISYFAFIENGSTEIINNESVSENTSSSKPRYEAPQKAAVDTSIIQKPEQSLPVEVPKSVPDSLQLSVQTTDRVWVKVYTDGKVVFQKMVEKSSNIKYRATKSFSVSVGNAGAVKILFNNKQVPNVGKIGESRNIYMTPETIRYYTIPTNENKPAKAN